MISKGELIEIYFKKENVDLDQYPFNLPFFTGSERLKMHPKVTYLVGENGTGKSTLLEAIAVASGFNPEGGSFSFNFNTRNSHSDLYKHLVTSRGVHRRTDGYFLRSESFFNVATHIEYLDRDYDDDGYPIGGPKIIDSYGGKSLHEQSHGESFWALFISRFRGRGFYVLDEPEAALSPAKQMAMLLRMDELINEGSQFVIATHSPILIAYPDSIIYEFTADGVNIRKYQETNLFQTYAEFFMDPKRMVEGLLRGF